MFLDHIFNNPDIQALGWALAHFVWQGFLLAGILALAKTLLRSYSANLHYFISCGTLLLMVLVVLGTFFSNSQLISPHNKTTNDLSWSNTKHKQQEAYFSVTNTGNKMPLESKLEETSQIKPTFSWKEKVSNILPWLVSLWAMGVSLITVKIFISYFFIQHVLKKELQALPIELEKSFSHLANNLGVTQVVQFYQSTTAKVPMVIGWFKPIILIPVSALTGLTTTQLDTIVLHELAHIKRYDYLINIFQTLIETLLFYHPAVWWVSNQIRIEREHCCDDIAVALNGDPLTYAKALVNLEESRQENFVLAANGGILMERVKRLLVRQPKNSMLSSFIASMVCLFLLISSALSMIVSQKDLINLSKTTISQNRTVAIGFVSLPIVSNNPLRDPLKTTTQLVDKLKQYQIPAIGFVQGQKLENDNGNSLKSLKLWQDSGLELGIGTYSHKWFFNSSYEDYIADVTKNENAVVDLFKENNKQIRYFSYPYLNTGANLENKERFQDFLKYKGYKFIPYTVDNDDWLFAKSYDEAKANGDTKRMETLRAKYLPYMERMFEFYENYSLEVFAREIPQILLLTPSNLNVDSFDDLVAMLKKRNYSFVSVDKATEDDAFNSLDTYTGKTGISWLQRWGITRGAKWREQPRPQGITVETFSHNEGISSKYKNPAAD